MTRNAVIYWVHIDGIAHIAGHEQRMVCGIDPAKQEAEPVLEKRTYYACMDCITKWAVEHDDGEGQYHNLDAFDAPLSPTFRT